MPSTQKKSLASYQKKRNFKVTPEPKGSKKQAPSEKAPCFVVHLHHARHKHYDLRLQIGSVLTSWAVPKGIPRKIGEKHLAIRAEDHPLDYATFKGTIPEGNYGAGTVKIWDSGTYQNIKEKNGKSITMKGCLQNGQIEIMFEGKKLRGSYALIRTNFGKQESWLLFKMKRRKKSGVL